MANHNDPQPEKLRSQNSHHRAFARFCNRTERNMALEWLNFQGDHVPYGNNIPPGGVNQMNTFVGHPWLFYESDCRHPLVARPGEQLIHFPVGWDQRSRPFYHEVNIVNPLLSLEQNCLNFLHRHISITCGHREKDTFYRKAEQLTIPVNLMNQLKKLSDNQHNRNIPIFILPESDEEEEEDG